MARSRLIKILCLVLCCALLTGCGRSGGAQKPDEAGHSAKETLITEEEQPAESETEHTELPYPDIRIYKGSLLWDRGFVRDGQVWLPLSLFCREPVTVQNGESLTVQAPGLELHAKSGDDYMQANGRYVFAPGSFVIAGDELYIPAETASSIFGVAVTAAEDLKNCDKSALLTSFTVYITEYKEAEGITVPQPKTRVVITGYDYLGFKSFEEENPDMELEIPVRLGELEDGELDRYIADGKLKVWKDGVEIPIESVPEGTLTADTIASLDSDGTLHVIITPALSGSEEAIAELKEKVDEIDKLGVTNFGKAAGIAPITTMGLIESAMKRIQKYQEGGFWNWLTGATNHGTLDSSMKNDFSSETVAELSAYVAEVITAIQTGAEVSEEDMANLQAILEFLNGLDETETGAHIKEGIAQGMTEAGWDADAETVASQLDAALASAFNSHSPAQRMVPMGENVSAGIGQGATEYDFSGDASTIASALESALQASLPEGTFTDLGTAAMSGLAESMSGYSLAGAGSSVGSNAKSAISGNLNASSLRPLGVSAMSGLAAGINAGRSSVVTAMRNAARAAVNAAKSELQIHSPSRVFRDEVGRMTMRGFGEGVLAETEAQSKAIRNAARYMTESAIGGIASGNTYDQRRTTYNQDSSSTIQVDKLYVRDEQDVHSLAIEIASLTRRKKLGRGMA